jgi:hypothetical protein
MPTLNASPLNRTRRHRWNWRRVISVVNRSGFLFFLIFPFVP